MSLNKQDLIKTSKELNNDTRRYVIKVRQFNLGIATELAEYEQIINNMGTKYSHYMEPKIIKGTQKDTFIVLLHYKEFINDTENSDK